MTNTSAPDLYTPSLRARAAEVEAPARLPPPCRSARAVSPVCGSTVTVDLRLAEGRIAAFGYAVEACALTRCSLSVLVRAAHGLTRDEVAEAEAALRRVLVGGAAPRSARWADLALLTPAAGYVARHNAIFLPFVAAARAFDAEERLMPEG